MTSLAVIIVTYERPDVLRRCLRDLEAQTITPDEIVVVDSSEDVATSRVVQEFARVAYVRNLNGYGHMTQSRNIGYRATKSDVVAFIDDDAFAVPTWAEHLLAAYDDDAIGGVGGRARNGQPGEAMIGIDEVGVLRPDGTITGNFAARPAGRLDVDHLIGCNMSFRRVALDSLGGFREQFPGTALREDTDICLRVKALGYRLRFEPRAVVDHLGAPHAKGRRFDARYQYFSQRNHVAMLIWNFGWASITRSYIRRSLLMGLRAVPVSMARLVLSVAATSAGIYAGIPRRRR